MAWRTIRRPVFAIAVSSWALGVLPAMVLTQAQGSQTQSPPPPPTTQGGSQTGPPPPPPPPPGETIRAVIFNGEVKTLSGALTFVGRGRFRRFADVPMNVPPANPVTDAKAALGRRLFFDPIMSADRSVSCSTCHLPDRAFTDDRSLAVGIFGRVGKRHSPSLVNRGYGRAHFWDARATTLETQVLLPIEDPNEMATTVDEVVTRLAADASYRETFETTFSRPVNRDDLSFALSTYLRTITSSDSPYDRFVDGAQDALSSEAQLGLQVFRTKARCTFCHVEPLFTDEGMHNTGVAWQVDADNVGRFADAGMFDVTKNERDRGRFKTPTLREIALTAPYMHDGSLKTLRDVVDFYDAGGRRNPLITPLLRPMGLSEAEKTAWSRSSNH